MGGPLLEPGTELVSTCCLVLLLVGSFLAVLLSPAFPLASLVSGASSSGCLHGTKMLSTMLFLGSSSIMSATCLVIVVSLS